MALAFAAPLRLGFSRHRCPAVEARHDVTEGEADAVGDERHRGIDDGDMRGSGVAERRDATSVRTCQEFQSGVLLHQPLPALVFRHRHRRSGEPEDKTA